MPKSGINKTEVERNGRIQCSQVKKCAVMQCKIQMIQTMCVRTWSNISFGGGVLLMF